MEGFHHGYVNGMGLMAEAKGVVVVIEIGSRIEAQISVILS